METTTVTDPQSGETICNNCGMVIAENIQDDARPEWRSFGLEHDNNNKSRIGNPVLFLLTTILKRWDIFSYRIFFKLTQPSTIIERINRDVNGIEINPAIHSQMERLRIRDIRAQVAAKGGLSVHSTNLIY